MSWFNKIAGIKERIEFLSKKYKLSEYALQQMTKADPTCPHCKYIEWIVKQFRKGIFRGAEDQGKFNARLYQFDQLKKTPRFKGKKDINQYHSFGELAKTLDENTQTVSKRQEQKTNLEKGIKHLFSIDTPYKGEQLKVEAITTKEAAAHECRNTEWCIKDPKYFDYYEINEQNPLLIVKIVTEDDEKPFVLLNLKSAQAKDVYDHSISDHTYEAIEDVLNELKNLGFDFYNPQNYYSTIKNTMNDRDLFHDYNTVQNLTPESIMIYLDLPPKLRDDPKIRKEMEDYIYEVKEALLFSRDMTIPYAKNLYNYYKAGNSQVKRNNFVNWHQGILKQAEQAKQRIQTVNNELNELKPLLTQENINLAQQEIEKELDLIEKIEIDAQNRLKQSEFVTQFNPKDFESYLQMFPYGLMSY